MDESEERSERESARNSSAKIKCGLDERNTQSKTLIDLLMSL